MSNTAIDCRNITKSYGAGASAVHALRGVDLTVATGELLMLVGPSGCGKTTLLCVIAGILDATAGDCTVFGQPWTALSGLAKCRYRAHNIGFVFQAFNLIPSLTVEENVTIPLLLNETPRNQAIQRARQVLERVGLGAKAGGYPRQLSGGQQQRVAIARALVHEPRLLVCDEPTSALDADTGRTVVSLLRDLALRDGRAVVVVTHDHRIFDFADRIVALNDGRIDTRAHS